MLTVGELLDYINENIADGCLSREDEVVVEVDKYDIESVNSLLNDTHTLSISLVEY